jgi:hypothetical protein
MAAKDNDPTEPMRLRASRYPGVDEGTACTQSSFKAAKKAFFFVGTQGGRYKAMFKLQASMPEATKLAQVDPDAYQVGTTGWVTARFTAQAPMPRKLWERWLDESYAATQSAGKKAPGSRTKKQE